MKIELELDYELMKAYAEFLGCEKLEKSDLCSSSYFRNRLVQDIEDTVERCLEY